MERSKGEKQIVEEFKEKEKKWQQERETLLKTVSLLEEQLKKQKALNSTLQKKSKHKRTSSQEQTFIFNQTNISSYFPVVVVKQSSWSVKGTLRSHLDAVRAVNFQGGHLFSSGEDATLKVWKREKLKLTVRQHLGPVYALASSEDLIFTGGAQGVVRMWQSQDILNGLTPCFEQQLHQQPIWSMIFNQKRGLLLTSSADQTLNLMKVNGKGLDYAWKESIQQDIPTVVEWMGQNRFLSGFRVKQKIGVYDTQSGQHQWDYKFQGRTDCSQTNCIQMSQKVKMIASGHEDHFVRFFDPNSNKIIKQMAAHTDSVTGLQFGGDNFQLLSTGHDGTLRVWDLRKYRCVSDMVIHLKKYDEGALCLSLGGEGQLAVGGADGSIKLLHQGE